MAVSNSTHTASDLQAAQNVTLGDRQQCDTPPLFTPAGSPESDNGRAGSEATQPGAARREAQGSRQPTSPVLIALPGQRAAAGGGPSGGLQAGDMAGLLGGSALARHHAQQQQQAQQQMLPSQRLGALLG